ncbi:hypothetical protein [Kiloniella antarctica]|uniref:Metal-dependent protein of the double-stranded beta helix superfamily-like protein n=1 Tax=Kiloniella antarctica TaxID=1550907 RepID=A0ABW5BHP8_9PROT
MFKLEKFVEDCCTAVRKDRTHQYVSEIFERAFRDPVSIAAALGEPEKAGLTPIYCSPDVTILNLVWKPSMIIPPHNHNMWAMIGVYGGREDNIFWRRIKDDPDGRIEAAGAKALGTGDYAPLGSDIIHSVSNPIPKLTGSIHVYGGDFFEEERSEWEPETLAEQPIDLDKIKALFND